MKSRPRLVIDARPLTHPQPGGFRSHVRALTAGLKETGFDNDADLIFYLDRPPTPEQLQLLPPAAAYRVLSPNRLKTDFQLFPAQIRRDAPDLVHGTVNYLPPNLAARTTLTLHDAFGLRPDLRGKFLRQRLLETYWSWMSRASVRRAARMITVSRHAAEELAAALRMPESAITTVYNGLFLPAICPDTRRSTNEILAFASADLRKNAPVLYASYLAWRDKGRPLMTLITSDERTAKNLKRLTINEAPMVCILTRPDDEAIARLYARAAVFVFPSKAEGFGLPPLEAMALGCPVVSSSASAMPEILGDTPFYFDPNDSKELAARLREVFSYRSEELAARIARGKAHSATFTPRRMAEETAAVWREALG